jgi:predicted nucleic acid-binding protein
VTGVLIDTGPLVAIVSERDTEHRRCLEHSRTISPPMLTCWLVVTEAAWLLRNRPASVRDLFRAFEDGVLRLARLDETDMPAIDGILKTYANLRPQLADAALVHLAERDQLRTIFTLDRRDFTVYRLSRNRRLQLIP